MKQQPSARPPQAPPIERRLRFDWSQWIGIPIIALVPVLAVAGVFGERWKTVETTTARLGARVDYAASFRVSLSKPMTVRIANRSSGMIDTVDVVFDSAYMDRFSVATFTPSPEEDYAVSLAELRPGETRQIRIELAAGRYGSHTGRIVVRERGGGDSTVIRVRTVVLP